MSRTSSRHRPLFPDQSADPAPELCHPSPVTRHATDSAQQGVLWLCLDFYQLPLEHFASYGRRQGAVPIELLAVTEKTGGASRILTCNEPAAGVGVRPGLSLNAALALAPGLAAIERRADLEQKALERLAAWAGQYTPLVSLEPPQALLLEIGGSLRLFGGLGALRERVAEGLAELGYSAIRAVAPTARGARWLARAGEEAVITRKDELVGRLGALSVNCPGWPRQILRGLDSIGVRTLRGCLRLPRDGFARRFGRARLTELDQAAGRAPDPRRSYTPPDHYRAELELPAETRQVERLLAASRRLLTELGGYLAARQGGVDCLRLGLFHLGYPATWVSLGLARPCRDPERLLMLLRERLNRAALPAPVVTLKLRAGPVLPLAPEAQTLFPARELPSRAGQQAGYELLENLQARLGSDAVSGLCLRPEHRPERSWQQVLMRQTPGFPPSGNYTASTPGPVPGGRPLWLFTEPQRLGLEHSQSCFGGRLRLLSGPERIETGWWDDHDVARDYYVARDGKGARLWIFKERNGDKRWFLHGVFG
ncbi:MAG: DNA polymerase Y family protein [Gammaproteobacteria bacterium]